METIERLIARDLVARLDRRPGQKEERYAHLLGAEQDAAPAAAGGGSPLEERVARLEAEVAELREAVESLSPGVHEREAAVKRTA